MTVEQVKNMATISKLTTKTRNGELDWRVVNTENAIGGVIVYALTMDITNNKSLILYLKSDIEIRENNNLSMTFKNKSPYSLKIVKRLKLVDYPNLLGLLRVLHTNFFEKI